MPMTDRDVVGVVRAPSSGGRPDDRSVGSASRDEREVLQDLPQVHDLPRDESAIVAPTTSAARGHVSNDAADLRAQTGRRHGTQPRHDLVAADGDVEVDRDTRAPGSRKPLQQRLR
jgi:hypothetical protein